MGIRATKTICWVSSFSTYIFPKTKFLNHRIFARFNFVPSFNCSISIFLKWRISAHCQKTVLVFGTEWQWYTYKISIAARRKRRYSIDNKWATVIFTKIDCVFSWINSMKIPVEVFQLSSKLKDYFSRVISFENRIMCSVTFEQESL